MVCTGSASEGVYGDGITGDASSIGDGGAEGEDIGPDNAAKSKSSPEMEPSTELSRAEIQLSSESDSSPAHAARSSFACCH